MKRLLATASLLTLTAPVFVSAQSIVDIETQIMFVLGRMAQLQALEQGTSVACALITSKTTVHKGEEFALIWNTYGARDLSNDGPSQYAPRGIAHIVYDKAGTLTYIMPFNGAQSGTTTCTTKVTILP